MVAVYHGWAMTTKGDHAAGIAHMRSGLARYRAAGNGCTQVHMLAALAEALWSAGQREEAKSVLTEGMALAKTTQEGFYEPELYRLMGAFLLEESRESSDPNGLESARAFAQDALAMATSQDAKSLVDRARATLFEMQPVSA
jgi:hypothetical protein